MCKGDRPKTVEHPLPCPPVVDGRPASRALGRRHLQHRLVVHGPYDRFGRLVHHTRPSDATVIVLRREPRGSRVSRLRAAVGVPSARPAGRGTHIRMRRRSTETGTGDGSRSVFTRPERASSVDRAPPNVGGRVPSRSRRYRGCEPRPRHRRGSTRSPAREHRRSGHERSNAWVATRC